MQPAPTLAPNRTPAATATLTLHPTVSMISTSTPSPVSTPIDSSDKIAFVSQRDYYPEIYVMSPDGSNPAQLTDNSAGDCCATWSPSAQSPVVQHPDCTSGWTRLAAGESFTRYYHSQSRAIAAQPGGRNHRADSSGHCFKDDRRAYLRRRTDLLGSGE